MTARRLATADELHQLAGDDPYALQVDESVTAIWAGDDGAVAWVVPSRRYRGRGHLTVLGADEPAVALLLDVLSQTRGDERVGVGSASLPRSAVPHLPRDVRLHPVSEWEWMVSSTPPPVQPAEDRVEWLGRSDHDDIVTLLRSHSGRHDAEPGQDHVKQWCGVRDGGRELVAVAAHTEFWRDVPFLASVATRGDQRGRGLGTVVTAFITRHLLEAGSPRVTLGMYSDNDVARRVYLRLGYEVVHRFASGRLVRDGA